MKYFNGNRKKSSYFEGWYFKQISDQGPLCFIPAYHINKHGRPAASLQIIANTDHHNIIFPADDFYACENKFLVWLDNNRFTKRGCELDIKFRGLSVKGSLKYKNINPPTYDIMGPFRYVPFMQCRHQVISFNHFVTGQVTVNGRKFKFSNDYGYIEGDRGSSFPDAYLWTQCNWSGNSVMVSAAEIPFFGRGFDGCIGFVLTNDKEYRFATYLGVKIRQIDRSHIRLAQRNLLLDIELIKEAPIALNAPNQGTMNRIVRESPCCTVRYRFWIDEKQIFDYTSQKAAFEWGLIGKEKTN